MFYCQRSSYEIEYESTVVSCTPASRKKEQSGKKVELKGYEVVFEDTVFFPEGGGQNTDLGLVGDNNQVLEVTRRGDLAVHFLTEQVEPGDKLVQKIDWDRRFDNMQQHSGQHLVSAILEKDYNINTLSWWMAESTPSKVGVSYIEVDKPISADVMTSVEDKCNLNIRKSVPVSVTLFQRGDPQLEEAHTRGLPDDFTGPIRLVKIGDLDNNLCCGTHVSNLAHLQAIKLLYSENKKGKTLLYFLVGSRVLKYLANTLQRERSLTETLRNGPDSHIDLVEKMQKTLKISTKTNSNLLKEIALSEAKEKKNLETKPSYIYFYRREGDNDYISTLTKELSDYLLIVIVGEGNSGQLVVTGQGEVVVDIGKKLAELLDGKGGGKGSRFNAKINSFKNISQVEKVIQSCIAPNVKMGVGDKVEGGEVTPSTEDQVILRDEDTRDSDSISLHDEGHHTFNNFIKQTSTDIIEEEETTAEPNHTNHGAVNLHDNNKLQDSESLNPIDDNDDMADIVDDAGDQCLDDDTKVDEYNSNPNNPANNPTTDTDDDFSNDFSPIKTVDPKKTNTAFLNNYDSESDQNTCSHDEHIPQQNKSEDDNENIYLELTGGTQLALPEVPELSFPDLPPDNLNLKPAASKNKEAMTHDTHELDNEPDQCNTFVTNHAAQQDIVQESFFSSTKDDCNVGSRDMQQQIAATTVYSPQQMITTTSAEEQLQSFHSNICTLAAQVDDINNGLSGMGRSSNQTITTMSSGGSAMTSSSCVVSLQSINVPLQPLYNSSNTQPLCKSTSQLEKEDQFENIMRCLQFPDSALQNQQSSTNMSTLDTIVSSLNSPSTTTVFIDTTAVAQRKDT